MAPVTAERDLQRVEHGVARILAETDRPVEVYDAVLEAIGGWMGWRSARSGRPGAATGACTASRTWHDDADGAPAFEALSEQITLSPGRGCRAA